MILETGREIQGLGVDLRGYLGVIGVSPSTYGHWFRDEIAGRLVERPPQPPSAATLALWAEVREKMKDLMHRRHYTFGLKPIWTEYMGRLTRLKFRELARVAREEANREKRKSWLRYEFTNPDVAHSIDLVELPRELAYSGRRYMARIIDDCTRCTLWKAISRNKGLYVGIAAVKSHLEKNAAPLVFKFDLEFGHREMETLLMSRKIAPLPNPPATPWFNGKNERGNKEVQRWLDSFGPDQDWGNEELQKELDFNIKETDELWERQEFGGGSRRKAYAELPRASVDRDAFLQETVAFRRDLLMKPDCRLSPMEAWRFATQAMLKKVSVR